MADEGSSKLGLVLSILIAGGALLGGYQMARRERFEKAFPIPALTEVKHGRGPILQRWRRAKIPYDRIVAQSLDEYCLSRSAAASDYIIEEVRGCPPMLSVGSFPALEAVVDYRNCQGLALLRKPAAQR